MLNFSCAIVVKASSFQQFYNTKIEVNHGVCIKISGGVSIWRFLNVAVLASHNFAKLCRIFCNLDVKGFFFKFVHVIMKYMCIFCVCFFYPISLRKLL